MAQVTDYAVGCGWALWLFLLCLGVYLRYYLFRR